MKDDVSEVRKEDQKKYCKCISKGIRKLKFENYKMKNGEIRCMEKFEYYLEKHLPKDLQEYYNSLNSSVKKGINRLFDAGVLLPQNEWINISNCKKTYWKDLIVRDVYFLANNLIKYGVVVFEEGIYTKDRKSICRECKEEFILETIIFNYQLLNKKTEKEKDIVDYFTPRKKKFEKALDTVTERMLEKGDFFDLLRDKYNKLKELYPNVTEEEFLSIENSYNTEDFKN